MKIHLKDTPKGLLENYKLLEDLKDGDASADKYNSQLLKFITPNVVMVFSNETQDVRGPMESVPNRV